MMTQVRIQLTAASLPGITVTRIIGEWGFLADTLIVNQIRDWRMGIIVGTTSQSGTSVPTPFLDEADFMWEDPLLAQVGTTAPDSKAVSRRFDVRSQRKMDEIDETLWFSAFNAGESTDQVYMRARVLVKLP